MITLVLFLITKPIKTVEMYNNLCVKQKMQKVAISIT